MNNNQTVPAPPAGFIPDTPSVNNTSAAPAITPIPPPAGFVPETQALKSDEIQINPGDSLLTDAGKAAAGTLEGIGEGAFGTLAGVSDLFGAPSSYLHTLAGDQEQHGTAQNVGRAGETLAEFVMGDAALKGLPMSDRLLKASKYTKMIEESPIMSRIFNAGIRALRGGAIGTAQGALKTENLPDALGAGTAGALGNAVVPEAIDALKAAPGVARTASEAIRGSQKVVQPEFQSSIRDLLNSTAQEAGVQPSQAQSLRDVAQETATAIKGKASQIYKQLDQAIGGTRFQTYDEQLTNVRRALRNSAGINPDEDGRLIERINDLEDAKAKAMDEAQSKGVDPKLIHQANAFYRQGSALEDLSKYIRQSSEGLRPELTQAGSKAAPEAVNPAKLASRVNRMYDTGRLHQAIGDDRADDLLRAVEDANQHTKTIATHRRILNTGARYAGGAALGTAGYEAGRHLLGSE